MSVEQVSVAGDVGKGRIIYFIMSYLEQIGTFGYNNDITPLYYHIF